MDLEIIKIASNTVNNKNLNNCTHTVKQKNPLCGDEMEINLTVKNNKIQDFGYQCKSCIYCQASVSLLSRKIKEKKINEIKNFISDGEKLFDNVKTNLEKQWKDFRELFNTKNSARKECLLLPLKTVLKALKI